MSETFALLLQTRIVGQADQMGLLYRLHICGNTEHILAGTVRVNTDSLALDYKTDGAAGVANLKGG